MIFSLFLICLLPLAAQALTLDTPLPSADQEARAKSLFTRVRCVVCQGEAIADSPADIAHDMRVNIREQIAAGKSDQDILRFLVDSYGDGILMQPPLKRATWLLWFGPLLILASGMWFIYRFFLGQRSL